MDEMTVCGMDEEGSREQRLHVEERNGEQGKQMDTIGQEIDMKGGTGGKKRSTGCKVRREREKKRKMRIKKYMYRTELFYRPF